MVKHRSVGLQFCLCLTLLLLPSKLYALPAGFQQETVLNGLTQPVYLAQLPDGRMLVLRKAGSILIFNPAVKPAQTSAYLTITNIITNKERGLTSIALDPNFASNSYIYVYYTHNGTSRNRISRFTHTGNTASLSSERLIWQDNQNVTDCCHYGGGLAFGPDGKLYLTTGEEFDGPQAQSMTRAGGKIIRINKDGTIPTDNPFFDGAGGVLDEIWALGLRNPYRAYWDLVKNRFYIGEVGGNLQATAREDIHLGRAGANYGWPDCEGPCVNPAYDDPIYSYGHTSSTPNGGAITVGFIYRGSQFPAEFQGALFFADYAQSWIKYLVLNPQTGAVLSAKNFATGAGAPVHLIEGKDGALYYVDYQGSVKRITYSSGNQAPVIQSATATPQSGRAPLAVRFSGSATDPENNPLTYTWVFGDGASQQGAVVNHTYTANGAFQAHLEVRDQSRTTYSAAMTIQVGQLPQVTIDMPLNGQLFRAGDRVAFSGTAADPDGSLSNSSYVWDIEFLHNAHIHPALSGYVGKSGTLDINTSGHDYHDTTGYRFILTVTDSDGLVRSNSVSIYPDKVDLTFITSPAGIPVQIDSIPTNAPFSYDSLIGFKHLVSAPTSYCLNGTSYAFGSWSDGGAASHQITVPIKNTSFTANYTAQGNCSQLPLSGLVLRLEADSGVSTSNGVVTSWADQSGKNNTLVATGNPVMVAGAPNGKLVMDFDATGDKLETTSMNGMPAGNTDRSVFLVANYRGEGYGGFAFGQNKCNNTFGTIVNASGLMMVQGWCNANDFAASEMGTGTGWSIQSAVLATSQLSHYRDAQLIDQRSHSFNTVLAKTVLGAEIDGTPSVNMQVAAVLVYNRALNATEQAQVRAYLQGKYLSAGGAVNNPPVANNDVASVTVGGTVSVPVLGNDTDDNGLDITTVKVMSSPAHGTTTVNAVSGAIGYTHTGSSSVTSDSFTYRVFDKGGLPSNTATVSISITTTPVSTQLPATGNLVLHLESDSGVTMSNGVVNGWADKSGQGNHLSATGGPTMIAGSPNGMLVMDFDGIDDKLETSSMNGIPAGNTDRSVFLVANYRGTGYGGFAFGQNKCNKTFGTVVGPSGELMIQGWCLANDLGTSVPGTGADWMIQSAILSSGQLSHYRDAQLIDQQNHSFNTILVKTVIGAELDGAPNVNMQVAAVLVYNRALNATEQAQVRAYLRGKYF